MFPAFAAILFVGSKLEKNSATSWIAMPRPFDFWLTVTATQRQTP